MNGCFELVQDYINETSYMHGFDIGPTYVWLKKKQSHAYNAGKKPIVRAPSHGKKNITTAFIFRWIKKGQRLGYIS